MYCNADDPADWDAEAAQQGFTKRSKYLYHLIQEARAYRADGLHGPQHIENRIEELHAECDRLRAQLANERQAGAATASVDDPQFVKRFVTDTHSDSSEIVERMVASGAVNEVLWKPVEEQLYFLVAQGELVYDRRFGFKVADGEQ
ncbi:hypothetical protein [Haladaptatus sp. NG-WS-4]